MCLKTKEKSLEKESDNVKAEPYGVEQRRRISPSSRVCGWHEGMGDILKIGDLISACFHPLSPGGVAFLSKNFKVLSKGIQSASLKKRIRGLHDFSVVTEIVKGTELKV